MSSPRPANIRRMHSSSIDDGTAGGLDVSWLLARKDSHQPKPTPLPEPEAEQVPPSSKTVAELTPPQSPTDGSSMHPSADQSSGVPTDTKELKDVGTTPTKPSTVTPSPPPPAAGPAKEPPKPATTRPVIGPRAATDEQKTLASKAPVNNFKAQSQRKSSWISNLSSKFSSSSPTAPRSSSVDSAGTAQASGPKSPNVEFGNPFNKTETKKAEPKKVETKKGDSKSSGSKDGKKDQPIVITSHFQPRRQSVLVSAGSERKSDPSPGFLHNALRRLSSGGSASLGKQASTGAVSERKVMNIDPNRDRVTIAEFDRNLLKRVAFCVDVEIAGFGAAEDEEEQPPGLGQPLAPRQSLAALEKRVQSGKSKKYKEHSEGAALRNAQLAGDERDDLSEPKNDSKPETEEPHIQESEEKSASQPDQTEQTQPTDVTEPTEVKSEPLPIPTTRKKEKKKRSEAERKERRERKLRHAQQNGLVPLELTNVNDDDSDSSPNSTPPGASTPNMKAGDQPTTDPLRIYKRCCQLRETTALERVKEQISMPSAKLAEAPGTVGILDLSGTSMSLADIMTLGDWLAVVPVRKLILDDCSLTDEALRVILSGLSGCKSVEQAKHNRKLPKRAGAKRTSEQKEHKEQMGVIEKLSLKNNPNITSLGWKHIALFLHISRSLKAIDLSGIPFPRRAPESGNGADLSRAHTGSSVGTASVSSIKGSDVSSLITKALSLRFGDKLEELILTGCDLKTETVSDMIDCAIKCKIRRLGLANNHLSEQALTHVVRYVKSGVCEGLDLGGNDLHGTGHVVVQGLGDDNPLFAISLADCNLTPLDLSLILPSFVGLQNFRFIDLSRNRGLFSGDDNAVPLFRKLLPRLKNLKRIHLSDVEMVADHVIALAEILPDCTSLAHITILENQPLIRDMNSKEAAAQEEACAFLTSLMTAVRVSQTIIAVEIEVPSAESSEVVKALASQVVAYSLRNMEQTALDEAGVTGDKTMPNKGAPDVLLHLVGHMDGYSENHDNDEPAPDEDYMIASTGLVKALGVCLGTKDHNSQTASRNMSPTGSGAVTPRQGPLRPPAQRKPKNVSLELCESARKIRMRLRPALIKEDKAGNDANYRRLLFLDSTLERIIQRFEDEYPETKVPALPTSPSVANGSGSLGSSVADISILSSSVTSDGLSKLESTEESFNGEESSPHALKLSRTSSNTSLAARALTHEEGRMHRFGQSIRREILKPTGITDHHHGTDENDAPESPALAALRERTEQFKGEEIRDAVEKHGADHVIKEMGIGLHELQALQKDDPEGFEKFKESQLAAQLNTGAFFPGIDDAQKELGEQHNGSSA